MDDCKLCDCRRLNLTLWKILNFREYSIDYDEIIIGILFFSYNCRVDFYYIDTFSMTNIETLFRVF